MMKRMSSILLVLCMICLNTVGIAETATYQQMIEEGYTVKTEITFECGKMAFLEKELGKAVSALLENMNIHFFLQNEEEDFSMGVQVMEQKNSAMDLKIAKHDGIWQEESYALQGQMIELDEEQIMPTICRLLEAAGYREIAESLENAVNAWKKIDYTYQPCELPVIHLPGIEGTSACSMSLELATLPRLVPFDDTDKNMESYGEKGTLTITQVLDQQKQVACVQISLEKPAFTMNAEYSDLSGITAVSADIQNNENEYSLFFTSCETEMSDTQDMQSIVFEMNANNAAQDVWSIAGDLEAKNKSGDRRNETTWQSSIRCSGFLDNLVLTCEGTKKETGKGEDYKRVDNFLIKMESETIHRAELMEIEAVTTVGEPYFYGKPEQTVSVRLDEMEAQNLEQWLVGMSENSGTMLLSALAFLPPDTAEYIMNFIP